jgi:small subunit ribosomal protein S19
MGKGLEELREMPAEEFADLCDSRIRRTIKRGANDENFRKMLEKVEAAAAGKYKKMIRTHLRNFPVLPAMVGMKIGVHKGNEFQIVEIAADMLGHRLGEFALTRKRLQHGKAGVGATRSSTAIATRK